MSQIRKDMPLFVRNEGEWACHYEHTDADGNILDQHDVHIRCEFPDDGDVAYRQHTKNIWPDGRTEEIVFDTYYDPKAKAVTWDNGRINGRLWEVDDFTIYLRFGFNDQPDVDICEMIQLSSCGNKRTRTWHWFKNEELFQRTIVTEHRVK